MNRFLQVFVLSVGWWAAWEAQAGSVDTIQLVDLRDRPVPGAVVYLDGVESGAPGPADTVVVDQVNKRFEPRVTVIRSGTRVEFPNSDAVSHHVYSFANPNNFELPLYKGEVRPAVVFDHAGLVTLGCNIHDSMLGYILVVDTGHYAVTDADGRAQLSGLDRYSDSASLKVWSPDLASGATVEAFLKSQPSSGAVAYVFSIPTEQSQAPVDNDALSWSDY